MGVRVGGASPRSDCAFNLNIRTHSFMRFGEKKHTAKKKKKKATQMQHIFSLKGKPSISRLVIQVA